MKTLMLIDGNSIFHRAFHALPPFKTEQGEPINAVYGFMSMLLNILNKEKPDYAIVAFDKKGKTLRHEKYTEYKATRKKGPDELYAQFPRAKEILRTFSIPVYEEDGYEADDLVGTLSHQAEKTGKIDKIIILTSDRDALQLVSDKTCVYAPIRGVTEIQVFTPEKVKEKYGISPAQIADFKGLMGDSSDNIKGVSGIGKKTAQKLITEYGNLENIYANLGLIKGKIKERLESDKENAFLSKHIGTIMLDAPGNLDLNAALLCDYDFDAISRLFNELNFKSLTAKLKSFNLIYSKKRIQEKNRQKSLF